MIPQKYIQEVTIHTYETDQKGKAKLLALFNIMLEAAWAHAQLSDLGHHKLKLNNMFWVLSRLHIRVNRFPIWQEHLSLETWSSGTDGMFGYREFLLKDKQGNILLSANTAWLILNLETHKMVSFRGREEELPYYHNEEVCPKPKRIRFNPNTEQATYFPIQYSEIDINKHLNSVKALERVLNNYSICFQDSHEIEYIEINYLKESFGNDYIAVVQEGKNNLLQQSALVRKSDNEILSLYQIKWRDCNNSILK